MEGRYELILFDVDGTLLDTSQGIYNSVRYAEVQMNFPKLEEEKLREFVGPPPKLMYQKLYGVDESIAKQATIFHREYGKAKAIYEARVYPGIEEVLTELKRRGYKLAVATLKKQEIAEAVLSIFHLKDYFDVIVGMDAEETYTKAMTIRLAMNRTNTFGKAFMVGDTVYDLEGAREVGVDFVGVLYGFGFKDMKEQPGYVREPVELLKNFK